MILLLSINHNLATFADSKPKNYNPISTENRPVNPIDCEAD